MAAQNEFPLTFSLTWKKTVSARFNFFLICGFMTVLIVLWIGDSYHLAFNFFLGFFPYLFLFLAQDMNKDEIDSGCLENVLFLGGKFRPYLARKNLFLGLIGISLSSLLFIFFLIYGLFTHYFSLSSFYSFLMGLLVGLYYLYLGGLLSFYFKGGSNVLIVIVAQVFVFLVLLFSATHRGEFIDYLDSGNFPDLASRLKFMALAALMPNFIIIKVYFIYSIEIIGIIGIIFLLQRIKIQRLELSRK